MTHPLQSAVDRHFCGDLCTLWDKNHGCNADRTAHLMGREKGECAWELEKIERERPGSVRRKQ